MATASGTERTVIGCNQQYKVACRAEPRYYHAKQRFWTMALAVIQGLPEAERLKPEAGSRCYNSRRPINQSWIQ